MHAVVNEGLGHIQGGYTGLLLELRQIQDKFVHADPVKGRGEGALDFLHEVVGVEYRVAGGFRHALPAQGHEIGQGPDHHQEVAGKAPDLLSARAVQGDGLGQIGCQEILATHGACAGSAAAVGGGEGLVQVQVDAVKSHVARADHTHHGVEVGTVVVAQATGLVNQAGDFQNVLIKDANGVGVGEHQTGSVIPQDLPKGLQIHAAVGGGGDVHHLIAAHGCSGGVGAVGRVRNDDLGAAVVAPGLMVLLDEQNASELAMGASGGLEGHIRHACDFTQIPFGGLQHLLTASSSVLGRQGVHAGKAGQGCHFFVNPGIVLHGAGAKGVETAVYAVDLPAQLAVVTGNVGFAHLRQGRCLCPGKALRQLHRVYIAGRQYGTATAGYAFLNTPT